MKYLIKGWKKDSSWDVNLILEVFFLYGYHLLGLLLLACNGESLGGFWGRAVMPWGGK